MTAVLLLAKVLGVFALLGATLWTLKRTHGGATPTRSKAIEVRGTTRLGKSASVTVLHVQGEELLVGVTEHAVTLLSRRPQQNEVLPPATTSPVPTARSVPELVDLVMTSRADVPSEDIASALLATRTTAPDGSVAPAPTSTDAQTRPEHPWTRLVRMSRQPLASRGAGR